MDLEHSTPEKLTRFAHALDWLDPADSIVELGIAGEGNMNCVLRAQMKIGDALIFKQSLPYVAKYPDIPAPVERLDVEANFYAAITRQRALAERMPAIVGYDAGARVLCLADLGRGSDFTHLYAQHSHTGSGGDNDSRVKESRDAALSALMAWLGQLHSLPLTEVQAEQFRNGAMRTLNHEHIFILPLRENNGLSFSAELADSATRLREDKTFTARTYHLGGIYLGNEPHESQRCLLHGDYYPGSWLAHETMGVMVIDPEFAFFGAPEFDVGVMLAHLTFAGFDRSGLERVLRTYVAPANFNYPLANQFAGVEITRRLLGVAQLPLQASDATKVQWLTLARSLVLAA